MGLDIETSLISNLVPICSSFEYNFFNNAFSELNDSVAVYLKSDFPLYLILLILSVFNESTMETNGRFIKFNSSLFFAITLSFLTSFLSFCTSLIFESFFVYMYSVESYNKIPLVIRLNCKSLVFMLYLYLPS